MEISNKLYFLLGNFLKDQPPPPTNHPLILVHKRFQVISFFDNFISLFNELPHFIRWQECCFAFARRVILPFFYFCISVGMCNDMKTRPTTTSHFIHAHHICFGYAFVSQTHNKNTLLYLFYFLIHAHFISISFYSYLQ